MSDDRIQFACETCGKALRAPASRAGQQADCPQCGDRVTVPAADAEWGADGGAPTEIRCPVCGAAAPPDAVACDACGELLGSLDAEAAPGVRGGPTEVTLGGVWTTAFEDWKRHFGMLLAGVVVAGLIYMTVFMTLYFGMIMAMFGGIAVAAGAGGGDDTAGVIMVVMMILGMVLWFVGVTAVSSWMTLGLAGLHLEAVRGKPDLVTLFRTPGFWRGLLCFLILGFFGTVLGYVPVIGVFFGLDAAGGFGGGGGGEWVVILGVYGIWFAVWGAFFVLFWPVPFLCLDRPDIGHVKPLWRALTMPRGSWGGHLAVGAAAYGILVFGSGLTCGIGLLAAGPMAGLLLAHAYDRFDRAEEAAGPRVLDPEGEL